MKRPLFWMGMVFLSVTAAFCHVPAAAALLCGLAAVLAALWLGAADRATRLRALPLLLGCVAAAGLWCQAWQGRYRARLAPVCGREAEAVVTVAEVSRRGRAWAYTGRATLTAGGVSRAAEATVTAFFPLDAAPGDTLRLVAEVRPLPEGFAALASGDLLLHHVKTLPAPEGSPHRLTALLARMRSSVAEAAARLVPGEGGGLLAALLVGERGGMTPGATAALRRAGLSHLAVVSGLHLSTLALLLARLLAPLKRRRVAACLVIAFCWGFALLTGLGPSALRAAVMLTLVQAADLFGRRGDGLTSLACAGILLSLLDPRAAGGVSFGLSFLATGGILLLAGPLSAGLSRLPPRGAAGSRLLAGLTETASVTTAAQIGAAPVLLPVFGGIPVWGLFANLPAAPLAMLLLPLGWASLLLSTLLPVLAPPLGWLCGIPAKALLTLARFFSSLPRGSVGLTENYQIIWLAALYLVLGLLLARRPSPRVVGRALLSMLAVLLAGANLSAALSRQTAELLLLNEGETLLLTRGGRAVLVGAPASARQADALADALERLGVTRLDAVLLPDPTQLRQPVHALAERLGCDWLAAPDTPSVRAFCQAAGLTLASPPEGTFFPLGVPAQWTGDGVRFFFADGAVLKSGGKCVILIERVRPLWPPGRDITRYRLAIGEPT